MVTICQQCGDKGWDNAFVYCIECLEFAVHRYCLNLIPNTFDEFVPWVCENCEKEMPNQPPLEKPTAISTNGSSQEISKAHIKHKREDAELVSCSKKKKCEARCVGKRHEEGHIIHRSRQAFEAGDCSSINGTIEKLKTDSDLEGRRKLIFNTGSNSDGEVSHLGTVPNIQQDHQVPAEPVVDPVWRGDFSIENRNQDTYDGFVAHVSNKACTKVCEEARLLKPLLNFEMLPKSDVWPKSFQKSDPSDESIALYFFPADISSERVFDALVENMMSNELALKATVENAELLLFTSTELPLLYWRFQEKHYLWGVFRGKQAAGSQSQSQLKKSYNGARSLDPAKDEGTTVERKLRKNVHRRYQEFNENDQVMLQHRDEVSPLDTWKKVHAKMMGPFHVKKKFSVNAYELDLPSNMGIGPVFNVTDLTPYHGPSSQSIPSLTSSSPNSVEPIPVPPLLVPLALPLNSSQHTTDDIEDVLDERFVSTGHGGHHQFLVKWRGKPNSNCTWIGRDEFYRIDPMLLECYEDFIHASELDLPSNMGIGPVFNVADLTPYHGPSSQSIPSLTSSSPNSVEPIHVPPLLVPLALPLNSSQHTPDDIEDVLDERFVSTRHGGGHQFLVKWRGKPDSNCTWIGRDEFYRIDPMLLECYEDFISTKPIFSKPGRNDRNHYR